MLFGDVRHGTAVLTQLNTSGAYMRQAGRIAIDGENLRQSGNTPPNPVDVGEGVGIAVAGTLGAFSSETRHRTRPAGSREEVDEITCQSFIAGVSAGRLQRVPRVERIAPSAGNGEHPCRSTAPPAGSACSRSVRGPLCCRDQAVPDEDLQMTPHSGGGQGKALSDGRGRLGSAGEQIAQHSDRSPAHRRGVRGCHHLHNPSVSYFRGAAPRGHRYPARVVQADEVVWQADEVHVRWGPMAALDGVSLTARAGRILGLLGPNGAGKTTLLEASVGLRPLTRGRIQVFGHDAHALPTRVRAQIGLALQDWGVAPWTRVEHSVRDRAALYRDPAPVADLMRALDLTDVARQPVRRLSGGQQRRLATALALVGRPRLAILDEPAAGLDPQGRLAMRSVLRELADSGTAIVLSSHIGEDVEAIGDDIAVLHRGRVMAHAPLTEFVGTSECVTFSAAPHASVDSLASALSANDTIDVLAPGRIRITPATGRVDPLLLGTITAWASAHGQPLREMRIGTPSLTDHYLALTGVRE